ncbi:MAG: hypothetical protein N2511_01315 [Thermodesulfovibrionales bacterium]|nr:hypothetical protein [Thermodesulfovibrionales bacterium]
MLKDDNESRDVDAIDNTHDDGYNEMQRRVTRGISEIEKKGVME